MNKVLSDYYSLLIRSVSEMDEVLSIGKSGGSKLPDQAESDIDIYVFCSQIPEIKMRRAAINVLGDTADAVKFSEKGGRFWGTIDFLTIEGTEICLMYFTTAEMDNEIESVLHGTRLDKEAGMFYPTGRCATMLSMYALYDKFGYIAGMKERLSVYPQELSKKLFTHHIKKANDTESFERAVSRADILFYHETVENAIDHFLQALFALNKCFFPSRKRSAQFIEGFDYKPLNCTDRLLQIIELGAKPDTLARSYAVWFALYKELVDFTDMKYIK